MIWSDEKKWNLDGPDGLACYWHDIRTEERYFSKRNFGGGTVMIWAGFSAFGKTSLAFVDGRLNADGYQQILHNNLLPFLRRFPAANHIFMHDNATIHAATSTRNWLKDRNIETLNWPSCSPDLNPIENLWGIMVRNVYENGKQYSTIAELKQAIVASWNNIDLEQLMKLAESMPKRVNKLIKSSGKQIKY